MIFWNRVEVYCGYSMGDFNQYRDILASGRIRYDYRLINRNQSHRARFGSFFLNPKVETQYYLYVHKNDYEKAMFLLHTKRD